MIPAIQRLLISVRALAVLSLAIGALTSLPLSSHASEDSLTPRLPSPDAPNEIYLLSTRMVGTACNDRAMVSRLQCEQFLAAPQHPARWISRDWQELISDSNSNRPTVVYIHGNRIERGKDRSQGMQIYRSLTRHGNSNQSIRFIIWSWPSSAISGPIKDYRVKANRTQPAAWQLAWFLDKLPAETRVSVLGYSYGARVVSGAMHVLGGGALGNLKLEQRVHPQRKSFRVALLAAAYDAPWIQPGHFYGRALSQIERLVIATNQMDPVMRFYHLSNGRGRVHALGKAGVSQPQSLGSARHFVRMIDFTRSVGRNHSLVTISGKMKAIWHELLASDTKIARSR